MKRYVFTFGTLYEPQIVNALLGEKPPSFLATLHGYSVFKGTVNDLPPEIKIDIGSKHDLTNFSFLYAKKSDTNSQISGKVYEITPLQEKAFDMWERYPKWYEKENVTVIDEQDKQYKAFIYVINKSGEKLDSFERVQGDLKKYIASATRLHNRLMQES